MRVPRGTISKKYDVIVVGAGHAGCEAALAAARLGLSTALITLSKGKVAAMSCNPAIGGIGKSHMVRELDALGGEMGRAADSAAIHFRRLNASKGSAVRARRVQCDVGIYHSYMLSCIESCENPILIEGSVNRLMGDQQGVTGVELGSEVRINSEVVVLTTGTFLRGLIHIGTESHQAGRLGEPPTKGVSESLLEFGIQLGRFKTGTPARIMADTVDKDRMETQPSEDEYLTFSHDIVPTPLPRIQCLATRTNQQTHAIIRAALGGSPLYTGAIKGSGPRYCPSIEDKVVRFPEKESHQVILEPMDLSQKILYPNGISTSLSKEAQEKFVHSINGLEHAEIIDYGYAIEYDHILPTQLKPTLETKKIPGLYLAGQVNGTSGYEEAAGQGLLAGINAAFRVLGKEQVVLGRNDAYLGVMIDDLVTRGTAEPYRMFSSRAEFRLLLREDNAVHRLLKTAEQIGLVKKEFIDTRRASRLIVEKLLEYLGQTLSPRNESGARRTLEKILRQPGVKIQELLAGIEGTFSQDEMEQAEARIKYQGYIDRQLREAQALETMENRKIPPDVDYGSIPGLSRELAEKLGYVCPVTFAQAGRVDGITPAALMVLSVWLKKKEVVPRGTNGEQVP